MKSKIRILLVEDQAVLRDAYCRMINDLGYNCHGFSGLGEVLEEEIIPYQPQLLLLDTKLPGTTGWAICEMVRKTDYGKTIGIIGMSSENWEQEWREAGADLFMPKKDITPQTLEAAIEKVLEKYRK